MIMNKSYQASVAVVTRVDELASFPDRMEGGKTGLVSTVLTMHAQTVPLYLP